MKLLHFCIGLGLGCIAISLSLLSELGYLSTAAAALQVALATAFTYIAVSVAAQHLGLSCIAFLKAADVLAWVKIRAYREHMMVAG